MTQDELAALDRAATQELLADEGHYFAGTLCDLAICSHGETAHFNHQGDGPFIAALWNGYRAGRIAVIDDGVVERWERWLQNTGYDGGINSPAMLVLQRMKDDADRIEAQTAEIRSLRERAAELEAELGYHGIYPNPIIPRDTKADSDGDGGA